jgi:hypothetical protein
MKMRDRGDVPGVTGEGTCQKTAHVIGKVGDDHFDNLLGKLGGDGWVCAANLWRGTCGKKLLDSG